MSDNAERPDDRDARILEKVLGRVRPSPVGLAMEKDVNPSPPSPRPAKLGPLATKIEQFIARAMRVIVSTLVEWMDAVWRKPCSDLTARSMAASIDCDPGHRHDRHHLLGPNQAVLVRHLGDDQADVVSSVDTPISARILPASWPIHAG